MMNIVSVLFISCSLFSSQFVLTNDQTPSLIHLLSVFTADSPWAGLLWFIASFYTVWELTTLPGSCRGTGVVLVVRLAER